MTTNGTPQLTSRIETLKAYRIDWHLYLNRKPCKAPAECTIKSHWNSYEEDQWPTTLAEARRFAQDDDSPAVRIIRVSRQVIIEESTEVIETIELS